MQNNEQLEIVWCAINVMMKESDIMAAIEKVVGRKALNARWSMYFDAPSGSESAIKSDLRKMARANHGVQPTAPVAKIGKSRRSGRGG
jgi:hypothetical protein